MTKEERLKIIEDEIALFKRSYRGRVNFAEVDSFRVTHNLQYLFWIEAARTEYFRELGDEMNKPTLLFEEPFMVARAEIDYLNPSTFEDEYEVLSRAEFIKNSSLGVENIIRLKCGIILAHARATLIHFNPKTFRSEPIPDFLREKILATEENCEEIIDR